MTYLLCIMLAALLGRAAWSDVARRRIPNWVVGSIALLWVPYALCLDPTAAVAAAGISAAMLLAGVAVWQAGWLGAGDAKLLAALGLWAGADSLLPMLLVIALCGGMIAGLLLLERSWRPIAAAFAVWLDAVTGWRAGIGGAWLAWADSAATSAPSVPYGVAIAAGGLVVIHGLLLAG